MARAASTYRANRPKGEKSGYWTADPVPAHPPVSIERRATWLYPEPVRQLPRAVEKAARYQRKRALNKRRLMKAGR